MFEVAARTAASTMRRTVSSSMIVVSEGVSWGTVGEGGGVLPSEYCLILSDGVRRRLGSLDAEFFRVVSGSCRSWGRRDVRSCWERVWTRGSGAWAWSSPSDVDDARQKYPDMESKDGEQIRSAVTEGNLGHIYYPYSFSPEEKLNGAKVRYAGLGA